LACPSHKWEVVQALAHHPLEIVTKISINGEYVIGTLVVGNENIGTIAVDEVAIFYFNLHSKEKAHCSTPPFSRIIAPVVTVEKATHNGEKTCDDGENKNYRRCYAVVIYAVEDIHDLSSFKVTKIINCFQLLGISG
jgi:hypothetical protein